MPHLQRQIGRNDRERRLMLTKMRPKDRQLPPVQSNVLWSRSDFIKGTVSRNSAKLGNYKMPAKLTET